MANGKIDPRDYGMAGGGDGKRLPAFAADTAGGVESFIGTLADVRLGIVVRGRKRGLVELVEYPGYALWLTLACIQALIKKLGTDTDKWLGAKVPFVLVRVQNPETEEYVMKYNVAHENDWATLLDEHEENARKHAEAVAEAERERAAADKKNKR